VNIYLVRVTTDEREHRVWAAATSRETAVDRVLDQVPEGWAACLMDDRTNAGGDALRDMMPGEVRELSRSMHQPHDPEKSAGGKALTRP
jgi:hypothetical protein